MVQGKHLISLKSLVVGILIVGMLSVGLVSYSQWLNTRDFEENAAVIRMNQMVQQEIATAHLWFEEALGGDPSIDIETDVHVPIARALRLVATGLGQGVMMAAIALFTLAVIFTVSTLPVEFDASSRALRSLEHGGYVTQEELGGARRVLNAAAMTYVASAAMAISQLIQYIWMAQSRN